MIYSKASYETLCYFFFFNDILVYSPSWHSHLHHLELVLQVLKKECLFAKLSKCSFRATEIDYLGYSINGAGVNMEKEKIKVVLEWPTLQALILELF